MGSCRADFADRVCVDTWDLNRQSVGDLFTTGHNVVCDGPQVLLVSSSRCEYEWVVSGAHDGPKIGCDTGCILGPAWVSPTALQPATRGPSYK